MYLISFLTRMRLAFFITSHFYLQLNIWLYSRLLFSIFNLTNLKHPQMNLDLWHHILSESLEHLCNNCWQWSWTYPVLQYPTFVNNKNLQFVALSISLKVKDISISTFTLKIHNPRQLLCNNFEEICSHYIALILMTFPLLNCQLKVFWLSDLYFIYM